MKRWIKISAITIGSLLAFIIAAICIVGWLVFTPAKLTAIVNKTAAKYLTCEMQVGEIDLDLFSSLILYFNLQTLSISERPEDTGDYHKQKVQNFICDSIHYFYKYF